MQLGVGGNVDGSRVYSRTGLARYRFISISMRVSGVLFMDGDSQKEETSYVCLMESKRGVKKRVGK